MKLDRSELEIAIMALERTRVVTVGILQKVNHTLTELATAVNDEPTLVTLSPSTEDLGQISTAIRLCIDRFASEFDEDKLLAMGRFVERHSALELSRN